MAVLLSFRASALLSCSALIIFGRPNTSGGASEATPNLAKSVLMHAVPRAVRYLGVLPGLLDAFLAVLPAPRASVLLPLSLSRFLDTAMPQAMLPGAGQEPLQVSPLALGSCAPGPSVCRSGCSAWSLGLRTAFPPLP